MVSSEFGSNELLALFLDVAQEVEAEHRKKTPVPQKPVCHDPGQRYNEQGQPLYRTRAVDPDYHAKLDRQHAARDRDNSFQSARQRSMR